jgi:aryl sulfotransferase
MTGRLIWLASYPKSGNTWLRVFLANLRRNGEGPVDINRLDGLIASDREMFDDATGVESSDLTPEEIERLRPRVYEHLAAVAEETLFVKIHDAYTYIPPDDCPLVPPRATLGAIYLIRNPLDVAVSFAHHSNTDIDTIIDWMGNEEFVFFSSPSYLLHQISQRCLSWSGHVLSWMEAPIRVLVLRYEDLKLKSLETFSQAAQFAGLPCEPKRVRQAMDYSDLKELQRQEQNQGFRERPTKAKRFFREGTCGGWRQELTLKQVSRLIQDHQAVMKQFGYLTNEGHPIIF